MSVLPSPYLVPTLFVCCWPAAQPAFVPQGHTGCRRASLAAGYVLLGGALCLAVLQALAAVGSASSRGDQCQQEALATAVQLPLVDVNGPALPQVGETTAGAAADIASDDCGCTCGCNRSGNPACSWLYLFVACIRHLHTVKDLESILDVCACHSAPQAATRS